MKLPLNEFSSLQSAIKASQPGQEIILGNGHHWEESLEISHPLKIISEYNDATKCIIELTKGSIYLTNDSKSVIFSGITVRRPKKVLEANHSIRIYNSKCGVSLYNYAILLEIY